MSQKIGDARKRKGLSQAALARATGMTAGMLGQIERGERSISIASLQKIAFALGASPGELVSKVDPTPPRAIDCDDRAPNERIRRLRHRLGLPLTKVADRIGTHFTTLAKIERGDKRLTPEWLDKIAAGLDVPRADLLGEALTIDIGGAKLPDVITFNGVCYRREK